MLYFRRTKNSMGGFAAFDAMILALFYVMFALALSVSESGDAETAKANLAAKGSDLNAAFEEILGKLTETGDSCPTSLTTSEKAICRSAVNARQALAAIGVTPDGLRAYVAANPGVLAEAWSVVLATDDDDDDLIEFNDLQGNGPHVDDLTFEAEFLKDDFSNGVSTDADSSITLANLVEAWAKTSSFAKALTGKGSDSKGGTKNGKKKKKDKGKKKNSDKKGDKAGKGSNKKGGGKKKKKKKKKSNVDLSVLDPVFADLKQWLTNRQGPFNSAICSPNDGQSFPNTQDGKNSMTLIFQDIIREMLLFFNQPNSGADPLRLREHISLLSITFGKDRVPVGVYVFNKLCEIDGSSARISEAD